MHIRRRVLLWSLLPIILLIGGVAFVIVGQESLSRKTPPPPVDRQTTSTNPPVEKPIAIAEGMLIQGDPAAKVAYSTPRWSPDGRTIAYVRSKKDNQRSENGDLYLAEFSNGAWTHRLLAQGADWPRWSPDGRQLAFNQGALAVMDLPSGKVRKLLADDLSDGESYELHHPVSWSPDGRYLFFRTNCWEWGKCGFYDVTVDKTIELPLDSVEGAWMPDNRLLLAVDPDAFEEGDEYLGIYDSATRNTKKLITKAVGTPLVVSADGDSAYFDDGKGISRLNLTTGKLEKVLLLTAGYLAWSPDGTRYAFLDQRNDGQETKKPITLYVGSIEDLQYRIVATSVMPHAHELRDDAYAFSWSPDGKWIAYTTEKGDITIIKP